MTRKIYLERCTAEIPVRERKGKLFPGCTMLFGDVNVMRVFDRDDEEAALEEFKKLKADVRYMPAPVSYYLVKEYALEYVVEDDDGFWVETEDGMLEDCGECLEEMEMEL